MAYQNIGTVTITGVVSVSLTIPPFVTKYSSTFHYYKFTITVNNDTTTNFTGYVRLSGVLTSNQVLVSVGAGKTHSEDMYYTMKSMPSSSGSINGLLLDEVGDEVDKDTQTLNVRSPPAITTYAPYTDKSSYVIGDDLSAGITISSDDASSNQHVIFAIDANLYDVDNTKVTNLGSKTIDRANDNDYNVDFSSYTLVANSYTMGSWSINYLITAGWKGDTVWVYITKWTSISDFKSSSASTSKSITVSKPTPTVKFGTDHTLPSTVTKGVSSDFDINIINTYSSDKSGYFKLQFGYPSTKTYTYTYVVCSGDTTFTVGDYTYTVSVTIPTNAPNGDYDVQGELRVDETQPSKCGS